MKLYVRHWYSINLVVGAVLALALALNWSALEVVQRLVALNTLALFVHQFEEYGFPGGEPAVVNIAMYASDVPDRFPLNQLSAMVTNVLGIIMLYGLPFFFPQALWLCLAPMLINFGQLLSHGVMTNIKLRGVYNPGLAAVVFLHLPISVYFIWYVSANGMITGWDWLFGFLYAAVCAGFIVGFTTYALFATRKTKWSFAPDEMARFDVEGKMERRGVRVDCDTPLPLLQRRLQEVQKKIHPDG